MKVGVLIKQVPDTASKIVVSGDKIDESGFKWVVSPYDEFGIEEALKLKDAGKATEVVLISCGPARVVEALRQGLAMGADRAIHIKSDGVELDPFTTATALAAAAKEESFNIIFAGKQAVDDDCGQVHLGVAEFLAWPHVSPVEHLELGEGFVTVKRPIPGGKTEVHKVTLPAVIGCDKGPKDPRYASLPGIMKAKSKPLAEKNLADLLAGMTVELKNTSVSLPKQERLHKMIEGDAATVAKELARCLREEAKVI